MKQRILSSRTKETSLKLKNGRIIRVRFNPKKVFPADPDSTLAIINALENHIKPGMTVADIGTGSGIIGISAAKWERVML